MPSAVRHAVRRLWQEPALATASVLTLALGIGACTVMFSIVQAVLLESMGITTPSRLVVVWPQFGETAGEFTYDAYRAYSRTSSAFEALALTGSTNWPVPVDIVLRDGRRVRATQCAVSATFFDVLGARPALGRTFQPDDDRPGAPPTVVLSAAFWRSWFGGDPDIVGRTMTIADVAWRVIGVMPPDFFYPSGADFWTPAATLLAMTSSDQSPAAIAQLFASVGAFHAMGRLKPGITAAAAQADATRFVRSDRRRAGVDPATLGAGTEPLLDHVFGPARRALWLLSGAVLLVLLVACANVTGLLVARSAARSRETAVRTALGASRGQLLVENLAESAVLAGAGGALGVGLAAAGLRAVVALVPPAVVIRLAESRVDGTVLAISLLTTAGTTLLVGVLPALDPRGGSLAAALRDRADRGRTGSLRARTRGALVVGQVALTLMLLVATLLVVESFANVASTDLGFDPSSVATLDLSHLDQSRYATYAARHQVVEALTEAIQHLPGVRSAAAVVMRPFAHGTIGWTTGVLFEGQPNTDAAWLTNPAANWEAVTPRYFESMDIPILHGRDFTAQDRANAPDVVIVSESLATRAWPGQSPIGKRLIDSFIGRAAGGGPPRWQTVVGVVGNARYRELSRPWPDMYVPFAQALEFDAEHVVVKAAGDPRPLMAPLAGLLSRIDPQLSAADVTTMDDVVRGIEAPWRFNVQLFSAFGAMAAVLTAIGIVGLMLSMVQWRRGEIGIRLALGAQRSQVVALIVRQGITLVAAGVLMGSLLSLFTARLLSSLLFGISARDPGGLAAVGAVVLVLGALACYFPARRAAAVDPCTVFRSE
jgi:predicted permease